jgi:hypothetical protein
MCTFNTVTVVTFDRLHNDSCKNYVGITFLYKAHFYAL